MAHICRLISLIFIALYSQASFALSDPAAYTKANKTMIYQNCKGSSHNYGDFKSQMLNAGYAWVVFRSGINTYGNCMEAFGHQCPIGKEEIYLSGNNVLCRAATSCQENATLVGGKCQCNAGFNPVGFETCEGKTEEERLEEYCGSRANQTQNITTTRPAGYTGGMGAIAFGCYQPPGLGCLGNESQCQSTLFDTNKGCMHTTDISWGGHNADGSTDYYGTATFTGGVCTPGPWESAGSDGPPVDEETPTPGTKDPKPCEGQSGHVNGVQVCLPYDSTRGSDGTSKTNNPDGSSSETTSTTECKGNKCTTTTTTTNRDSNGNSTGTSTKTDTTTKEVYCQKNPAAGACKGNGTTGGGSGKGDGQEGDDSEWGGSCTAGWECDGDAIQCAIAQEQHKRACEVFDDKNPDVKLYGDEKGKTGIQRGEGGDVGEFDLSNRISVDPIIGSGSCLSDLQIQFMGKPLRIPLSNLCPYLEMLGNILAAVGMIMAIRIVGVR